MNIFGLQDSKVNCETIFIDTLLRGSFIGSAWGLSFYRPEINIGTTRLRYAGHNAFLFSSFIVTLSVVNCTLAKINPDHHVLNAGVSGTLAGLLGGLIETKSLKGSINHAAIAGVGVAALSGFLKQMNNNSESED